MPRALRQLLALYARFCSRPRQALLLPAQSIVSARHLLPLARLAQEIGIDVRYTLSPRVAKSTSVGWLRTQFEPYAQEVSSACAHRQRWSLIMVADHGHFRTLLGTGSAVAHIGHGNPSKIGARHPHLPWEYGQAPRNREGQIAYATMIESSDRVRDALISAEPDLDGRIQVLGRLLDDEMLADNVDRDACLKSIGLPSGKPVLMVASTLREHSLFGLYWDALLQQLRPLADYYQIVLCPHPREYAMWKARLGNEPVLRVLPPQHSAERLLAISHALVTDFSSLSQKAALLDIPMVLSRCDPLPVWPDGATARLYKVWPTWDGRVDLAHALQQAEALRGDVRTVDIKPWINSRPGMARKLFGQWLKRHFATPGC